MTDVPPPDPDAGAGRPAHGSTEPADSPSTDSPSTDRPSTGVPSAGRPAGKDPAPSGQERAEFRGLFAMRRARIAAELERNRAGDHVVPTWVLFVILLALIAAVATVIIVS